MNLDHAVSHCPPPEGDLDEYLAKHIKPGQFSPRVVALLAAASTWAYSDVQTFTDKMCRNGLKGRCVEISITNEALLLSTTLYVFQGDIKKGDDKNRFVVLAARGTMPRNLINWLMDASTKMVVFMHGGGHVHSGMYLSAVSVWVLVREILAAGYRGEDIVKRAEELAGKDHKDWESELKEGKELAEEDTIPLYITGHSAGGAIASIIAAGIHLDPKMDYLTKALRSVCVFGSPMFADKLLAANLHKQFGDKYFRFEYENDVVPRLPGRTLGDYEQFGQRYISSSREGVWVQAAKPVRQGITTIAANLIGVIAWLKDNMPWLRNVELPFSWGDHSPVHYWATSLRSYPFDFFIL
ncbi:alpha/beta fold hydrolase [Nannocystis sp. SCPEA4]|uniref:lipase family protein n=1 Tax=Nannocystis sp. SCPEA4 TaxID=2996787 RepID=UPI00226E481F|nr:alpha/beta fold hydrolase [Nannocystis sp. SCPEA4]MCY1059389.1 alpha/beta fold hydrolase [Nannocystis sp. SCPEA4]